jgi:predicted enzyme related to lactoylglutathione lyase
MDIKIHATVLPYEDPDGSLAFYRDALGFEIRQDVKADGVRWITVGPPAQPGTSIILQPPAGLAEITEQERQTILEMTAEVNHARIILATADLDGVFERLEASGAEVVQEPIKRPDGVRDCAFFDRAYNLIRINELREPSRVGAAQRTHTSVLAQQPEPHARDLTQDERSKR